MRIALHQTGDVATRAAHVLLAERRVDHLGLVDQDPRTRDPRVARTDDLAGYDIYVSDDLDDPHRHADRALDAGISCVLWSALDETDPTDDLDAPADLGARFAMIGRTLLVGSNLGSGIAPALASHESARNDEVLDVMYAWTEPGKLLRRGEPIPFPDPIGARWGRLRPDRHQRRAYVAPVPGEWAGAMAKVTAASADGVIARIVGVADLAVHLEALALAAGVLSVADMAFGVVTPSDRPEPYLAAILAAGLDVAAYSTPVPQT